MNRRVEADVEDEFLSINLVARAGELIVKVSIGYIENIACFVDGWKVFVFDVGKELHGDSNMLDAMEDTMHRRAILVRYLLVVTR